HLGSTRMVTGETGTVAAGYDYLPFGEVVRESGGMAGQTVRFTGKEREGETGLDYFLARYYSAPVGRFTSPDAPLLDQSPSDPQSWNLFSYVRNNPLKFTDPTGQDCVYTNNGDGTVGLERGNSCSQKGGTYVNGTIDANSFTYDAKTNSIGYTYSNAAEGTGGAGSIGLPNAPTYGDAFISEMGRRADASNQFIGEFAKQAAIGAAAGVAGRVVGAGVEALLAARAARLAAAAVDVANLSNKIVRQMAARGWTAQEIVETVQSGKAYNVINKATGGPATEYVNSATGKFVVVDNTTKQVLQVSGPGFLPNH
ncbi:MAG: RHS repeat-associated core domain-containing protein, partial [bacterium]